MKSNQSGFTMVEILVAMVVLAIGLLGMAAMTVLVVRGNKGASDLTAATNICQLKLEELKDVAWDSLGSLDNASATNVRTLGLHQGGIVVEGGYDESTGLNGQGKTMQEVQDELQEGQCDGEQPADCAIPQSQAARPYKFKRFFTICSGWEYGTGTPSDPPLNSEAPDTNPYEYEAEGNCKGNPETSDITPVSRSRALNCFPEDIATAVGAGNKEKKIKVLCTWRSSEGRCHSVSLDTTVVSLN